MKIYGDEIPSGAEVVVGIDQSYTGFGLTVLKLYDDPIYRSFLYKSKGNGVERLVDIRDFLHHVTRYLADYGVHRVAMEGYANGAKFGREMAGELGGMVKTWSYDAFGKEPYSVAPSALKKYVTGKGTGIQKNQMLLQVYRKWGVEWHDDNLADSYALARLISGRHTLEYEREVYEKVVGR